MKLFAAILTVLVLAACGTEEKPAENKNAEDAAEKIYGQLKSTRLK